MLYASLLSTAMQRIWRADASRSSRQDLVAVASSTTFAREENHAPLFLEVCLSVIARDAPAQIVMACWVTAHGGPMAAGTAEYLNDAKGLSRRNNVACACLSDVLSLSLSLSPTRKVSISATSWLPLSRPPFWCIRAMICSGQPFSSRWSPIPEPTRFPWKTPRSETPSKQKFRMTTEHASGHVFAVV